MSKANSIDPSVPAGSEDPKLGDNRIREHSAADAELWKVDHYMGTDGGAGIGYNEDAAGRHNKVTLRVQDTNPTSVADTIILFAKDVDDKAEAHIKDEDGNVTQLTTAGKIKKSYLEDNSFVPTGGWIPYGGTTAPAGWLLCDGSAFSRTTYADLFAVLGTAYGVGDGLTTFNVPDMCGRVPVGLDVADAHLSAADALGETGGEENHTLTTAEMPAHTHKIGHGVSLAGGAYSHGLCESGTSYNTSSTGGGGAHNNLQPYNTCNYIIKT